MPDLLKNTEKSAPRISIGLVVYNGVTHIRNVLDSIASQSYRNIELIVVDGGSTDGTQKILQEYADGIAILVSEPDKGIYDAMNKVRGLATGDWLIFLGCDDVLLDILGEVSGLLKFPGVVYYGDVILRSRGVIYGGKTSRYKLMQSNICHQAIFYPRSVYRKYSYSLTYKWLADYEYNIKLAADNVRMVYLGKVISIYNDKGVSSHGDDEFEHDKLRLIRSAFGWEYALIKILRNLAAKMARMFR